MNPPLAPAPASPPAEESVAGEEDPGSALEQFSELMGAEEAPPAGTPHEPSDVPDALDAPEAAKAPARRDAADAREGLDPPDAQGLRDVPDAPDASRSR